MLHYYEVILLFFSVPVVYCIYILYTMLFFIAFRNLSTVNSAEREEREKERHEKHQLAEELKLVYKNMLVFSKCSVIQQIESCCISSFA